MSTRSRRSSEPRPASPGENGAALETGASYGLLVWIIAAVIGHTLEAPGAYRAAKKRGKDPWKYFLRTLALGAIVLIPLLRSEPETEVDPSLF